MLNGVLEPLYKRGIDPWLELASFMTLLMRVAWVAPLYRLLVVAETNVPWPQSVAVLFGVALVVYSAVKAMGIRGVSRARSQWLAAALLAPLIPLSFRLVLRPHAPMRWADAFEVPLEEMAGTRNVIPDEAVVFVAVVFVWYMAMTLARQGIGTNRILTTFTRGAVVFAMLAWWMREGGLWEFVACLSIFLFAGLLALKTARMGALHRFRNAAAVPFTLGWLGELGGVILLIAAVSVGAGLVFAGPLGQLLLGVLSWSLYGLAFIVITPVLWLATPVFNWLRSNYLNEGGPFWQMPANIGNSGPSAADVLEGVRPEAVAASSASNAWVWAALVAVAAVAVAIALWRTSEAGRRAAAGLPEFQWTERESVLGQLRAALAGGLQEAWGRLRGRDGRYADRLRAAQKVRRLYGEFLDLCIDLDVPRPAAKTPLEFVPVAAGTLEGQEAPLMTLTNAYLKVRYGGLPEDEAELREVEGAWAAIEAQGKGLLKERRS